MKDEIYHATKPLPDDTKAKVAYKQKARKELMEFRHAVEVSGQEARSVPSKILKMFNVWNVAHIEGGYDALTDPSKMEDLLPKDKKALMRVRLTFDEVRNWFIDIGKNITLEPNYVNTMLKIDEVFRNKRPDGRTSAIGRMIKAYRITFDEEMQFAKDNGGYLGFIANLILMTNFFGQTLSDADIKALEDFADKGMESGATTEYLETDEGKKLADKIDNIDIIKLRNAFAKESAGNWHTALSLGGNPHIEARGKILKPRVFSNKARAALGDLVEKDLSILLPAYARNAGLMIANNNALKMIDGKTYYESVMQSVGELEQEHLASIRYVTDEILQMNPRNHQLASMFSQTATGALSILFLPFVPFLQMMEPIVISAKTGRVRDSFKVYWDIAKYFVGEGTMMDYKLMAELYGIVADAYTSPKLEAMFEGIGDESTFMGKIVRNFFLYSGLVHMTRATRVAALVGSFLMLQRSLYDGTSNEILTKDFLINNEQIEALRRYMMDGNELKSARDVLMDAEALKDADKDALKGLEIAMNKAVDDIIQQPNKSDRPAHTETPLGRAVFFLMSFGWSFERRMIRGQFKKGLKQPTHFIPYMSGLAGFVALTALYGAIRLAISNPEKFEELEEDDELLLQMIGRSIIRVLLTGRSGIIPRAWESDNIYSEKDAPSILVADVVWDAFWAVSDYFTHNSPETHAGERKLFKKAIDPLALLILGSLAASSPPVIGVPMTAGLTGFKLFENRLLKDALPD